MAMGRMNTEVGFNLVNRPNLRLINRSLQVLDPEDSTGSVFSDTGHASIKKLPPDLFCFSMHGIGQRVCLCCIP
jgi:hypothetical protein